MKIRAVQTPDGWQLRTPHGNPVGPRMLRQDPVAGRSWPPGVTTFPTQAQAEKAAFEWTVYLLDCAKTKARK